MYLNFCTMSLKKEREPMSWLEIVEEAEKNNGMQVYISMKQDRDVYMVFMQRDQDY